MHNWESSFPEPTPWNGEPDKQEDLRHSEPPEAEDNCVACGHAASAHDSVGCLVGAGKIRQCLCRHLERHAIDTETLRCSCGASMCMTCGECSSLCDCVKPF
jgi:hypothetical protein